MPIGRVALWCMQLCRVGACTIMYVGIHTVTRGHNSSILFLPYNCTHVHVWPGSHGWAPNVLHPWVGGGTFFAYMAMMY